MAECGSRDQMIQAANRSLEELRLLWGLFTVAGVNITVSGTNVTVPSHVTADAAGLSVVPPASAALLACVLTSLEIGAGHVQFSGTEYQETVSNTWSLFNSFAEPTCIVYPRITGHVQTAMTNIFLIGANYAVQSGAHSAMVGWNSITNGVLISFAHMNSTTYNPSTNTITVLPGVHWGDAEDAVEQYGVSAIGGRASDVGTGLLLGGGISFVSTPLVTASATNQYSDLFRALKGGANRFGIVTRYELYAAHTGTKDDKEWYGGVITYPGSAAEALSNASAKYIRETTDPKAGFILLLNSDTASPGAHSAYVFYKGKSLPQNIFGDFLSIESTSQSLSPLSYYDISFLIPGDARGNGQQFGATSWLGNESTFLNGYNHFLNFTNTFSAELASSFFIISPIPSFQWTASRSGPNAIGSPGVSYATIDFWLIYQPNIKAVPPTVQAGFEFLFKQTPPSPGLPLYVNEGDATQNMFATYPNYATLKETYAKYDPLRFNVQHTRGPIGL
ncbi:FAD-binding protein [Mycena venus]|uniref:FAD-binding protein n=1 Tax=Mycena venus TaxID=2733690 RepID=A0A8H7CMH8_9AGAR|nr:FAD-binding protein [Mycena venus]